MIDLEIKNESATPETSLLVDNTVVKKIRTKKEVKIPEGIEIEVSGLLLVESFERKSNGRFGEQNVVNLTYFKKQTDTNVNVYAYEESVRVDMEFSIEYKGGTSSLAFSKSTTGGVKGKFYTPETIFMEESEETRAFLNSIFDKKGSKNVFLFEVKSFFNTGSSLYYQTDIDFAKIPKGFVPLSESTRSIAQNIDDSSTSKDYNRKENIFIDSVLQKNALDEFFLINISSAILNEMKQRVEAVAINVNAELSEKKTKHLLSSIYRSSGERPSHENLSDFARYLAISDAEANLVVEAMSTDTPINFLIENIAEIPSISLLRTLERYKNTRVPFIDVSLKSAEDLLNFVSDGAPLGGRPMAILSMDEVLSVSGELKSEELFLRFSDKDEKMSNLTKGDVITLLKTQGLYTNFGAGAIQANAILKIGEYIQGGENKSTVISKLTEDGNAIAKKWIAYIDTSTDIGKSSLIDLSMNLKGKGQNVFFVKGGDESKVVYAFSSSAGVKEIVQRYSFTLPTFDEIFSTIPTLGDFLVRKNSTSDVNSNAQGMNRVNYAAKKSMNGFLFSAFFKENTDNAFEYYLKNIQSSSNLNKVRTETITSRSVAELRSEIIEGEFSILNIKENVKIFPDLMNVESNTKYSIKGIAANPIMTAKYLQMPGMSKSIKSLLQNFGYTVPNVHEFMYNLSDPKKNILPIGEKDVVSSNDDNMGILNYKYVPPFISISDTQDKDKFIQILQNTAIAELEKIRPVNDSDEELVGVKLEETRDLLDNGKIIALKTKIVYDKYVGLFKQEEFFTIMNNEFQDIGIINVPPMKIYEEMKKSAGLSVRNRTTSIVGKDSVLTQMYHAIYDFIEEFYKRNSEEWIDEAAIKIMRQVVRQNLIVDSKAIYEKLLKNGKIAELAKKTLGERPSLNTAVDNTIKEASKIYFEKEIPFNAIIEKGKILHFIKDHFYGKEKEFFFGKHSEGNKLFFNNNFADSEYVEILWSNLSAVASYDNMLATAASKILDIVYFRERLQFFAEELGVNARDLPTHTYGSEKEATKISAIHLFLKVCLGLSSHQALEAKSFTIMNLSGQKNTELLLWEMRTGKTRTMLAVQMLLSLVKKSDSIFFVQNKNFDDIIMQAWDMQPLLVSEMALFVGGQNRFNVKNFSTSMPLSKSVFPNIPVIFKRLLKNPIVGSHFAPAEYLAKSFVRDFEIIKSTVLNHDNPHKQAQENPFSKKIPFFLENTIAKKGDLVSVSLISTFYYIKKLVDEGFIDLNEDTIKKIKKSVLNTFFSNLASEEELLQTRKSGNIIFAGKQYIDNFAASNKVEIDIFGSSTKTEILSEIDLIGSEISLIGGEYNENSNPEKVNRQIMTEILAYANNIAIANDLLIMAEGESFVVPAISINETEKRNGYFSIPLKRARDRAQSYAEVMVRKYSEDKEREDDSFAGLDDKDLVNATTLIIASLFNTLAEKLELKGIGDAVIVPYASFRSDVGESFFGTSIDLDELTAYLKSVDAAFMRFDANSPKEATKNFIAKILSSRDIALILSHEFYKNTFVKLMSGHSNISSRGRISEAFGSSQSGKSSAVIFEVENISNSDLVLSPARRIRKEGTTHAIIEKGTIVAINASAQDPSLFNTVEAIIKEVHYEILGMGVAKAVIRKASLLDENNKEKEIKREGSKVSESLSSNSYWENEPRNEIASVTVDEGHKNTSPTKGFQAKSLLESITDKFEDAAKIVATGTPLAGLAGFARLMETMSGVQDAKFASSIIKHCGNFKFNSDFLSILFYLISSEPEMYSIFEDYVDKNFHDVESTGLSSKGEAEVFSQTTTSELFDRVWNSHAMKDTILGLRDDIGSIFMNFYDAKADFEELMKNVEKSLNKKAKVVTVDIFWTAAKKMTHMAAGFSNPTALASFFDFIGNANTSIKRPSNDITYDIKDRKSVNLALSGEISKNADISELGDAILLVDLALDKYRRALYLPQIKNSILVAARGVIQAMRDNPIEFGFKSTEDALSTLNRSQSSVTDGMDDIVDFMITKRGLPVGFSDYKKEVLSMVLDMTFDVLTNFSVNSEKIANAASIGENEVSLVIKGKETLMLMSHASLIRGHFSDGFGSSSDLHFSNNQSENNAIFLHDFALYANVALEKGFPIEYEFKMELEVEPWIPSVQFSINAGSLDDKSILEVAAFIDKTSALSLASLNKNENQRVMTTRVAITNMAIASSIAAAYRRDDTSKTVIIIVNATDKRIERYITSLSSIADKLSEKNIKVEKASPLTINASFEAALDKKEQMMVISNYESLAEGYNMEFIDTGFYLGSIDKTASATQSFARQIGHNKKISSFYLANDGHGFIYKGGVGGFPKRIGEAISHLHFKEDTAIDIASSVKAIIGGKEISIRPSHNGKNNGKQMLELIAYEHFMSGALSTTDINTEETVMQWLITEESEKKDEVLEIHHDSSPLPAMGR